MNSVDLREVFGEDLWSLLNGPARDRLSAFAADLLRFNRSQNLVSRADPARQIALLLEESVRAALALAEEPAGGWLDVGSGGGIPGIPLSCVWAERAVVLVERRQGRCDFLRREVSSLGLSAARVVQGDVESLYDIETYGVVTAKAVAEPGVIEGLCAPVIRDGGSLVLFQRAGWRAVGDLSPGGWIVSEVWAGLGSPRDCEPREGFRLRRPTDGAVPRGTSRGGR